jgi:hypothetical protein
MLRMYSHDEYFSSLLPQTWFVFRNMRLTTLSGTRLTEYLARMACPRHGHARSVVHMLHRTTTLRRAPNFPDAFSRRIDLSSSLSATSFSNRVFNVFNVIKQIVPADFVAWLLSAHRRCRRKAGVEY